MRSVYQRRSFDPFDHAIDTVDNTRLIWSAVWRGLLCQSAPVSPPTDRISLAVA